MIYVKDLLAVAYDAAALATLDPGRRALGTVAEDGGLLDLILSTAEEKDLVPLTQTVPVDRRADLAERLGSSANASDYPRGAGWEAVVIWVIDALPRSINDEQA